MLYFAFLTFATEIYKRVYVTFKCDNMNTIVIREFQNTDDKNE